MKDILQIPSIYLSKFNWSRGRLGGIKVGIKNIHIALISVATILAVILGFWGISHQYKMIGIISFIAAVSLLFYGISFLKKAKTL